MTSPVLSDRRSTYQSWEETGLGVEGAEVEKGRRGRLWAVDILFLVGTSQIGSVIGFWINFAITEAMSSSSSTSWRIPMGVQLIPAVIHFFIGGFFLHESPLWLMRKERHAEAHQALQTLRKLPVEHPYLQQEIQPIQNRLK